MGLRSTDGATGHEGDVVVIQLHRPRLARLVHLGKYPAARSLPEAGFRVVGAARFELATFRPPAEWILM